MKNTRFVVLSLVPVFLLLLVFTILPIFLGLGIAFYEYNPLNVHNTFVGFDNFARLFEDPVFAISLKNTLLFVVVTAVANIVLTLLIAQLITSFKSNKVRGFFRVIFFMPCVAPLVASSVVWNGMYATKYGLVNDVLKALFNIPPHNWLGNPDTLLPAIIVFTLWADIGYNIILFCAGMDGIPSDFYEAAAIDGAGPVRRFFSITLPLLGRTTGFVVSMTLISYFQMFAQFEVMTRTGSGSGGPNNAGMVLTLEIYKEAFKYKEMGYASAIAVALFLIIMVFTVISQRMNRVDWGY